MASVVQVLCHVTMRLQRLHAAGLVHRDLKARFTSVLISRLWKTS